MERRHEIPAPPQDSAHVAEGHRQFARQPVERLRRVVRQAKEATSAVTALAPAVWGSTYLVTTEFLPPDRPLPAATARALPAGLILLLRTRTPPQGSWWWRAVVLGVLNIGAFFHLLFRAAYHLPGGVAALVLSAQPMIVLLLGSLPLKDTVRPLHLASRALGALSMASGNLLTKRRGRPEGVGLPAFTGWQLILDGLVLLPVMLVGEPLPDHLGGRNIGGFACPGIIGALLAYALWFRGLAGLPALAASFLSFAPPLCAMALGCPFLDQTRRPLQLLGAAGVAGAVILGQPRGRQSSSSSGSSR
ncbi:EamA family transporter [Streptomyces sp. NPDC093018]|uniref:EamA family transporter n=1 Tax=Streptomyces sp. NPDC093018 TaxID=3155067 RepID=UPI00341CC2CB